jgi:hypothetical protein
MSEASNLASSRGRLAVFRSPWWLGGFAVAVNLLYASGFIQPCALKYGLLTIGLIILVPLTLWLGGAWTSRYAEPKQHAGLFVVLAAFFPVFTDWPFWLSFQLSRPVYERMADAALSGTADRTFGRVGLHGIQEVWFGADGASVALLIDPNRAHPHGFVRAPLDAPGDYEFDSVDGERTRFTGSMHRMDLGGRWSFREDD